MKKRDYNKYDFASWVKLDATSPSGISWVAPRRYMRTLRYDRVGTPAGSVRNFNNRQYYYTVVIMGKSFFTHRVAYVLKHGTVNPNNDIDHIDGNSLNNSIENLREVDPIVNGRNKKKKAGKELSTGIYLENYISRAGTPLTKIRAHYSDNNSKIISRSWSVLNRGYELSLELALAWRAERMKELCEQGFGYTERHGT